MKRLEILFAALLLPLDALALLGGFSLAYRLRDAYNVIAPEGFANLAARLNYTGAEITLSYERYLHYLAVIIPVMLVLFALTGLYAIRPTSGWVQRFLRIVIGVSAGESFVLFLFLLKRTFFIPRLTVIYSWVLCILLVLAVRLAVRAVQKLLYARGIGTVAVGVVGKNEVAQRVVAQLGASRYGAYRLKAHLDSLPVKEALEKLAASGVDELIIVSERYSNAELIAFRNYCLEAHIAFSFVPPLLSELPSVFEVRTLGRLPVVEVRPTPLEGWGRVIKRLFDLVASLILVILFSPLFLAITLLMKLTDPGPLIFRNRRIGKNGAPIDVWKFRTMRWEYCDGPNGHPDGDKNKAKLFAENPELAKEWAQTQKLKNDPRVTRIGRFLRASSLDELPQFFNVLGGSLSLVGPRPIIQEEVRRYGEKAKILFTVKPGVTGLWQVSGRNDVSYEERIALDSRYIEHWSLLTDIVISFKTGLVLAASVLGINRKGAY